MLLKKYFKKFELLDALKAARHCRCVAANVFIALILIVVEKQ